MLLRFDPFREIDRMTQETFRPPRFADADGRVPQGRAFRGALRSSRCGARHDRPDRRTEHLDRDGRANLASHEGDEVVITERPQGTFSRQLLLGDSLDTERITARYDQGVLTITIPVAEQSKARKVEVAHGGGPEVIEATSS